MGRVKMGEVIIISKMLNSTPQEIALQALSIKSGVDIEHIRNGTLTSGEFARVVAANREICEQPVYVV